MERKLLFTSVTCTLVYLAGCGVFLHVWFVFSGIFVMPAGPNWTSNPECKRICKLFSPWPVQRLWTKCIHFISAHVCMKAGCMSPTPFPSFHLLSSEAGGAEGLSSKVCARVCVRNLVRMLCDSLSKCITTNQQMVMERRRLLNRAPLHHHHTHVLSPSLASILPLILIPLLYFHLSLSALLPSLSRFPLSW